MRMGKVSIRKNGNTAKASSTVGELNELFQLRRELNGCSAVGRGVIQSNTVPKATNVSQLDDSSTDEDYNPGSEEHANSNADNSSANNPGSEEHADSNADNSSVDEVEAEGTHPNRGMGQKEGEDEENGDDGENEKLVAVPGSVIDGTQFFGLFGYILLRQMHSLASYRTSTKLGGINHHSSV